jgi:hypothetical protein
LERDKPEPLGETIAMGQHAPESVVLILQGDSAEAHPGIIDGYERLRAEGQVREISVFPVFGPAGASKGKEFWRAVIDRSREQAATLVVFQYYHSPILPDPRLAMRQLRTLPSRPFLVSTLGDPFMNGYCFRPEVPRSFLQAAEASDLVTLTSMGAMADHVGRYTRAPIILSPNGACQVRFGGRARVSADNEAKIDVVFVGSRNASRNPLRPYYWFGKRRTHFVMALRRRFGNRFAVFGNGWNHLGSSAQGPIPFAKQAEVAREARVIVGGIPFSTARYYTSNRPFIQMTSGVPVVDVGVPGVDLLLKDRIHWVLSDEAKLLETVDEVLTWEPEARAAMGRAAAEYVLSRHTQAHRVAALVENVRRLRTRRDAQVSATPHLPFFHDDVAVSAEMRVATRNWPGMRKFSG